MSVAEWLDYVVAEWLDYECGGVVRLCVWWSG